VFVPHHVELDGDALLTGGRADPEPGLPHSSRDFGRHFREADLSGEAARGSIVKVSSLSVEFRPAAVIAS